MAIEEKLPPVGSDSCPVDVVGVPGPDRVEGGRLQGERGRESGGIVESEVGAEPIYHAARRHAVFIDRGEIRARLGRMGEWVND